MPPSNYQTATPQAYTPSDGQVYGTRSMGEITQEPTRPIEENKIRPIVIRQLSHGYVVEAGCQTFAIENASTLIAKLTEYLLNPATTEEKHREGKLFQ